MNNNIRICLLIFYFVLAIKSLGVMIGINPIWANDDSYKNFLKYLPEILQINLDKSVEKFGPNCWNATLVATGILPELRYSTYKEMTFWMNSKFCREKDLDEPIEIGDVIAIRELLTGANTYSEVHGFIYMDEKLSFSKNGATKKEPYLLQSTDMVFSSYNVLKECRRIKGIPKDDLKCLQRWANIYKCEAIKPLSIRAKDIFEDKIESEKNNNLKHIWLVEKLDHLISKIIFNNSKNILGDDDVIKDIKGLDSVEYINEISEKKLRQILINSISSEIKFFTSKITKSKNENQISLFKEAGIRLEALLHQVRAGM